MTTPIPAFKHFFQVTLEGVADQNEPEYFYSVEGLGVMYEMERYIPGGYGKTYNIPTIYETDRLIFKRPLLEEKSSITKWCEQALDTNIFKPTIAHVFIFNKDKSINNHWSAEQIYPIGLKISPLELDTGSPVMIETITMAYARLNRVK